MITFKQGEDIIINVPMFQYGASMPTNIKDAVEIRTHLYIKSKQTGRLVEVGKYALNPAAGYGDLKINANDFSIDIEITAEQSKNFSVGILKASSTIIMPDDAFESGGKNQKFESRIARVSRGLDLDETLELI